MNSISRMIAWRYITRSTHDGSISTMAIISFLGIFVGSFSLALVTAIMHGFDIETQKKMQGIHAQATIHAYDASIDSAAFIPVLMREFPEIIGSSPSSTAHALIQANGRDNSTSPTLVVLKAIDPHHESLVSTLHEKITCGSLKNVVGNAIIIGARLAETLHIHVGDTIQLLYSDGTHRHRTVTFKEHEATVKGILNTGIDEFDTTVALCSFSLFDDLFPDIGIKEIQIKLAPHVNEQTLFNHIKNRFDLGVYSWKDMYPAIVSALKLEKYVSFFVLALISLVASMNIISLLFMIIADKKSDIAILKAMGARNKDITRIFLFLGIMITFTATFFGIFCATLISWLLEHYPFIELPDAYYVSHLPARMAWYIPCLVLFLSIIMCTLAIYIPIKKIKSLSIAQTLRFEG